MNSEVSILDVGRRVLALALMKGVRISGVTGHHVDVRPLRGVVYLARERRDIVITATRHIDGHPSHKATVRRGSFLRFRLRRKLRKLIAWVAN